MLCPTVKLHRVGVPIIGVRFWSRLSTVVLSLPAAKKCAHTQYPTVAIATRSNKGILTRPMSQGGRYRTIQCMHRRRALETVIQYIGAPLPQSLRIAGRICPPIGS